MTNIVLTPAIEDDMRRMTCGLSTVSAKKKAPAKKKLPFSKVNSLMIQKYFFVCYIYLISSFVYALLILGIKKGNFLFL